MTLLTPAARWGLRAVAAAGAATFVFAVASGDAARSFGIYLVNFLFWSGLAQAAVAYLAILQLTRAGWAEPLRGLAQALSSYLLPSLALALVLPFGHGSFYTWLAAGDAEQGWLSPPAVSLRLLLGLALLHGLGLLFARRPAWRDRLAPALLVAYAVVLTMLSFDWVMSLDSRWLSTLFGGHFFIGALYAGLAAVALLAVLVRRQRGGAAIPVRVLHDQGKLLLGFCMLWMYLVYSQYIVIWYGDLPEETGFLLRRTSAPWASLAVFVVASCFFIPFLLLLSRRLKQTDAGLAAVAGLALIGLFAERFLLVMPSLTERVRFGPVEIAVSVAYCASFLLFVIPALERDNGSVKERKTAHAAASAILILCSVCGAGSALAQTGTWEAPAAAKDIKRPAPADERSVERGRKLFRQNCVPCHGESGRGDGPMGKALGIKPGNLTSGERMARHADGEIFWKISKGKEPMPVFEQKLSSRERWDLVGYVRTLAK